MTPDFEALRASRNAQVQELFQKLAAEHGTAFSHDRRTAP